MTDDRLLDLINEFKSCKCLSRDMIGDELWSQLEEGLTGELRGNLWTVFKLETLLFRDIVLNLIDGLKNE